MLPHINKFNSITTALCLAAFSFPAFKEQAAAASTTTSAVTKIDNVDTKVGEFARCGSTTFSLRKDHVKHFLVASNGSEQCEILCPLPPGVKFSAQQRAADTGLRSPAECIEISIGDESLCLIWFAGGSFCKVD